MDADPALNFLASAGVRTGVAPLVTTCFGPRTAAAGFTGRTWLTTSQSQSTRIAARVLLDGRDRARVGPDVGGHSGAGRIAPRPRHRSSHHARNCPTARPYAARVRSFAIRPAKNSRNRATASGPASTITCGRTSSPSLVFDDHRLRDRRHQALAHSDTSPPSTSPSNRS